MLKINYDRVIYIQDSGNVLTVVSGAAWNGYKYEKQLEHQFNKEKDGEAILKDFTPKLTVLTKDGKTYYFSDTLCSLLIETDSLAKVDVNGSIRYFSKFIEYKMPKKQQTKKAGKRKQAKKVKI